MALKVRPGLAMSEYVVERDGSQIGWVHKKTTRYNLRRVITTIQWYAKTKEGQRIPAEGGYSTRRDAVAALDAATPKPED